MENISIPKKMHMNVWNQFNQPLYIYIYIIKNQIFKDLENLLGGKTFIVSDALFTYGR